MSFPTRSPEYAPVVESRRKQFRSRIYGRYVTGRAMVPAPATFDCLAPRAPMIVRLIARHFPMNRQAVISDLGCGYGAIVFFARQAGYVNVHGVDGSYEQVAAARKLGIEGVVEGDLVQALAVMDAESQDCIVMYDVIEHFSRDELVGVVDAVFRALRPGGRWIVHTPNGESPFFGRIRYGDLTHELAFTRTSIAHLLYASGFVEVRSFEDEPIPHGLKSSVRWILWKCIRFVLRLYLAVETGDNAREAIFSQSFLTVAIK